MEIWLTTLIHNNPELRQVWGSDFGVRHEAKEMCTAQHHQDHV